MSSSDDSTSNDVASGSIDSPPASEQSHSGSSLADESRQRLHRLAGQLVRTQNRRLLAEFLTLRRSLR